MLYVAITDAGAAVGTYGALVSERDQRGHLKVGAGIPAGPDAVEQPAGDGAGDADRGPEGAGVAAPSGAAPPDGHAPDDQPPDDVVQAVADFVDDLVDDAAADRAGDTAG